MSCERNKLHRIPPPHVQVTSSTASSSFSTCLSTLDICDNNAKLRRRSKILAASSSLKSAMSNEEYYSFSDCTLDKNIDLFNATLNSTDLEANSRETDDYSTSYLPLQSRYTVDKSVKKCMAFPIELDSERRTKSIKKCIALPIELDSECQTQEQIRGLNKNSQCTLKKRIMPLIDIKLSIYTDENKILCNYTGGYIAQIIKDFKKHDKYHASKRLEYGAGKLTLKKVAFSDDNKENIKAGSKMVKTRNQNKHLKNHSVRNSLVESSTKRKWKHRDINENVHHNTTESFVFWENWCQDSENSSLNKSQSCTALSELSSTYCNSEADDECSITANFSCIAQCNDTFPPAESNSVLEERESHSRFRRRANSCDSILRDVRRLPQEACEIILRAVFEQLAKLRKEQVSICSNYTLESASDNLQVRNGVTSVQSHEQLGDDLYLNQIRTPTIICTSPKQTESTTRNRPPKKPAMMKNVIQRGLYSWEKKVTSPVGEYIKGKRPSPFKTSPTK